MNRPTRRPVLDRLTPLRLGLALAALWTIAGVAGIVIGITLNARAEAARPTPRAYYQALLDRGGAVTLPADLALDGPLLVRGNGKSLRGPSNVHGQGNYVGPLLAIGVQAAPGEFSGDYRPPGAFATLGRSALAVTAHPLQYGLGGDGYATTDAITVNALVERKPGQDWQPVCGMSDEWTHAAPWQLLFHPQGFILRLSDSYALAPDDYRVLIPCPTDPGTYGVSVQFDPASGKVNAWVNSKLVATTWQGVGGAAGWPAGTPLRRQDGFRPFLVGASGTVAGAGACADLVVRGLRVSRSAEYRWDTDAPVFAAAPDTEVTDQRQFGTPGNAYVDLARVLGALDFSDDGRGDPWVWCDTPRGRTLLWWTPQMRPWNTSDTTVENVTFTGGIQATVQLHAHYALRLTGVNATGGQGVGALPYGPCYPILFERCRLQGTDAALVLRTHLGTVRDLEIPVCGVDAVRAFGGDLVFDRVWLWRTCPETRSLFRFLGHDDGGNYAVRGVQCDNEERAGEPLVSVVDCTAGPYKRGRLSVDGLQVARCDAATFLRLDGAGLDGQREPWQVDARGIQSYIPCESPLRIDGKLNWYGTVDLRAFAARPGMAPAVANPAAARVTVRTPVGGLD
jgi:hypothetical protein